MGEYGDGELASTPEGLHQQPSIGAQQEEYRPPATIAMRQAVVLPPVERPWRRTTPVWAGTEKEGLASRLWGYISRVDQSAEGLEQQVANDTRNAMSASLNGRRRRGTMRLAGSERE